MDQARQAQHSREQRQDSAGLEKRGRRSTMDNLVQLRSRVKMVSPERHSPKKRPRTMKKKKRDEDPISPSKKKRSWTTAGSGRKTRREKAQHNNTRKRPWTRALPELQELRNDVHAMKQIESGMVFNASLAHLRSGTLKDSQLSAYQKQKDNEYFENSFGRFPRALLHHPMTTIPKSSLDVSKWETVVDDGTVAWIALVNGGINKFSIEGCLCVGDIGLNLFCKMSPGLAILNLSRCRFSPQGLQAMGSNSKRLTELILDNCPGFDDDALYAIANAEMKLSVLSLRNCSFLTDKSVTCLVSSVPSLVTLMLDGVPLLTDRTVNAITKHLNNIKHLSLIGSMKNVGDGSLELLVIKVKSLERLNIPNATKMTNNTIQSLVQKEVIHGMKPTGGLPNLSTLNISGCPNLDALSISWLAAGCDGLAKLDMSHCQGDLDLGLRNFGAMRYLVELDISSCTGITDDGLEYLGSGGCGRKLKYLNMRNMTKVTDRGIHSFITTCKNLEELNISDTTPLSDVVLSMCLRKCKLLKKVVLAGLPLLGKTFFLTVRDYCPSLYDIDISRCAKVTGKCLDIWSQSKKILKINVSGCPLLTDDCLVKVPNWWLTHLIASNLPNITDNGIISISKSHLELETLDISYCNITNKSIAALKKGCKKLKTLNVFGCGRVNERGIRMFGAGKKFASVCTKVKGDNFVGVRMMRAGKNSKFRHNFWKQVRKEKDSTKILVKAYRAYRARVYMHNVRKRRRRKRWVRAITIQKYTRRFLAAAFVRLKRYRMTSAAIKIQYTYRLFVKQRAYRKAMLFWRTGTERHYFLEWVFWTEEVVSQRTTSNARAQERQANFFARHMFEKTWMIPALRLWLKWAKTEILNRKLANDKNARAMAFFKNHTELTFFRIWKAKRLIGPNHRKKLVEVYMQCVSLASHNSTPQLKRGEKAVGHYNSTIRYHYRHAIFDILHQNVLDMHHKMEEAKFRAVMIFRNRASHAVMRTWIAHVQLRLYKKECVRIGEQHFIKVARKAAMKKLLGHAKIKIKKRNQLHRAMKYWLSVEYSKIFSAWIRFVSDVKYKRQQAAKALIYFQRHIEVKAFRHWIAYVDREKYNRNAIRQCMAHLKFKAVKRCFNAWFEDKCNSQRLKVKLLMRWRKRELMYFFDRWWDIVGPRIEARHSSEAATELKFRRETAAAIEIQRIARGYLATVYCEKHRFAFDWATKYIQSWWRVQLAKGVRRALWRHRHLKDWKKAELEHPLMEEEERISWELDAWWRASTFVSRCWRGYKCRKEMYHVRKIHQDKLIHIHQEKSKAILLEAEKREERRQEEHEHKVEVVIMLQCLFRMYAARKILHRKWQENFYRVHTIKIQSMYRMRYAIHRAAAKARWLVMRKKVRAQKWRTALLMKIVFGANTKQKQDTILKGLSEMGLHPEGFVFNPFVVLKEVIFDIYYAQREMRDTIRTWKVGGFNSYLRKKEADRIFDMHLEQNLPHKGDAVQVVMVEYKRRGETGKILNIKTVNEGTNAERRVALVKFDKTGDLDWLPFKQEATAYSEILPALLRVPSQRVTIMDVEAVKNNRVALLAYADTALELRKEYRAARLVQMAFRSKRAKRQTDKRRQKMKKITAWKIKVYKRLLHLMCFADNASFRELLIARKVVRAKYLPEELYPESSATPKWLKKYLYKRKLRKIRKGEIDVALKIREGRVRKAKMGREKENMVWRVRTKSKVSAEWRRELRRKVIVYPLANAAARMAGNKRYTFKFRFFKGVSNLIGRKAWRRTAEEKRTWAGEYKFENMHDSPHVTANGLAMYHGTWNKKGQPHGQGYALFLKGDLYATPSSKVNIKTWAIYHTIEGFFENGRPCGAVYILYKDQSIYEGHYNGEPGEPSTAPKEANDGQKKTVAEEDENSNSDEEDNSLESANSESTKSQPVEEEEDPILEDALDYPYRDKYLYLKRGIRNRTTNPLEEKMQLVSPTKLNESFKAAIHYKSPYDPRKESLLSSSYSMWQSGLVKKPRQTLQRNEFESFVRIGTPQERIKLTLPPPVSEVITPEAAPIVARRSSADFDDDDDDSEHGFSRPGTAMTGIFSESSSRPGTSNKQEKPDGRSLPDKDVNEEASGNDEMEEEKSEDGQSAQEDDNAETDEVVDESKVVDHDSADDDAEDEVLGTPRSVTNDEALEDGTLEVGNEKPNNMETDELPPLPVPSDTEAGEDEESSVASSLSTQSYDEKYFDKDWGIWTTPEGDRYEGYLVDNNFDPKGKDGSEGINGRFYILDHYGESYDGDLVDGIREGKGVYRYDDGTYYEGDWISGKKHGVGKMDMASGEVYDGSWRDDVMNGYGVHMFPNGDVFEGNYKDGKWNGYGTFVGSNGAIYNGGYLENERYGLGRMVYVDGGRYEGDFEKDIRSGHGVFYLPHKTSEEPGMRMLKDGTPTWYRDRKEFHETYTGPWVDDKMHGTATYKVEQPGGWIKIIDALWVRGIKMKTLYTHPYKAATDWFCDMLRDPSLYRGSYGMSVVEKFPLLPDGVDKDDKRIPGIVRGLLKAWRSYKWEIPLIGRTLFLKYDKVVDTIKDEVEECRDMYREAREKIDDIKEEYKEQKDLVEEEKEAYELATALYTKLKQRIQTYWDTDEIQEDDEYEKVVADLFEMTEPEDFREINLLVAAPNPVFEKMMKIVCIIFYCEPDWNNIRIMCSESERAILMGDKTAVTKGPFRVKLYNEIRHFDVYKLAEDKERLEQISDMAYDPLIQPSSRLIRGVSPAAVHVYNLIKPILHYALQARKLLPWKRELMVAKVDYEDCKMSYEDELETYNDLEEDLNSAKEEMKQKGQEWRDKFHEAQKTIVIYEKIKRMRSGRDKSLTLENMKVVTPASTARSGSDSSSSSGSSGSSSSGSSDSSDSSDSSGSEEDDDDDDDDDSNSENEEDDDDEDSSNDS